MRSPRATASIVVLAFALSLVALFVAPLPLAGWRSSFTPAGREDLVAALVPAFVADWDRGLAHPTPDLASLETYWARFHALKAVIAMIALVLNVVLVRTVWRAARPWVALLACLPAVGVGVILLANLQGAFAPAASLQSMLPLEKSGSLGEVLNSIRVQLQQHQQGAAASEPLADLIAGFARYHWVFAALSGVSALCLVLALGWWRRTWTPTMPRAHRRAGWALISGGCIVAALLALLAVANVSNALHPVQGLLGWVGTSG